jgi:superfamily II DNA/RNA helicase
MQVAENFDKYGKYHKLNMALLIGGTNMADQIKKLEKGVDVLIATPGRLMDLFGRGKIMLNGCSLLVIDEADRMLDMGFIPDIEEICSKLPKNRQTLLFSATMPPVIKKLADKFLTNPKQIEVARPAQTNMLIDQRIVKVDSRKKRDALADMLRRDEVRTAIVFCNRKTTVRELATSLKRGHLKVGQIHGDMEQRDRIAELERFKADEITILIASDVAARGLDIKGVSHVFNYDVPWHPDDYVHRIGRTGRAGKTGVAITLVTPADAEAIDNIQKLTSTKIAELDSDGKPERPEEPADSGQDEERPRRGRRPRGADKGEARPPREPRAEREPRTEREPREERTPRPEREPRAERAPRPDREPRPARDARPPRSDRRNEPDTEDDGGWNGPVPSFLDKGFGS